MDRSFTSGTCDPGFITMPSVELLASPYALYAKKSNGIESIDSVSNPNGNIDLVAANSITILPDNDANTITIGETHSAGINNPHLVTAVQTRALISVDGVSNAGGDINLIAGSNITITPDDESDTITISSSSGSSSGIVVQRVYNTYSANSSTNAQFSDEYAKPESTQGTEFLTVTITPRSADNKLRIKALFWVDCEQAASVIMALFKNDDQYAIAASSIYLGNDPQDLPLTHYMDAGTTDPIAGPCELYNE